MPEPYRPPTLRITCNVWSTVPSTVAWLQFHRDSSKHLDYLLLRGINANIILLCATCIEGFLVETLKSFMPSQRTDDTSLRSRLTEEYYERVHTCPGYAAISNLFRLATGRLLSEIVTDKPLQEAISVLFTFRNGLAHGRSTEYRSYVGEHIYDYELEFWGSYSTVEDYLIKIGLLKSRVIEGGSGWDLLTTEVADYFTKQVAAYCRTISTELPLEQSSRMNSLLKSAFDEKLKWA
jgi:hypothetical protein